MRLFLIALFLAGLAIAFSVKPDYLEVKDSGNQNLPKIDVGITIDCDTKNLTVLVESNETEDAVSGAKAYLFYTDYSYQALPNPGTTNADGIATIPVPGTIRFLNALFIMRVDAQGFQSREIEFVYEKCFEEPPPPPPQNITPPGNHTPPPANQTPPVNQTPPGDITPPANQTPPNDSTPPIVPPPEPEGPCPAGLVLLAPFIFSRR